MTKPTFESLSEQILNQFYTSCIDTTVSYVERYHVNPPDLEGNKVSSYREYGIVYGSNIDYVKLGIYRIEGLFTLPDVNFNEFTHLQINIIMYQKNITLNLQQIMLELIR